MRNCSGLDGAWPTGLEFAFGALPDVPVGSGVTRIAVPEDNGGVGFDHDKLMGAARGVSDGHDPSREGSGRGGDGRGEDEGRFPMSVFSRSVGCPLASMIPQERTP